MEHQFAFIGCLQILLAPVNICPLVQVASEQNPTFRYEPVAVPYMYANVYMDETKIILKKIRNVYGLPRSEAWQVGVGRSVPCQWTTLSCGSALLVDPTEKSSLFSDL